MTTRIPKSFGQPVRITAFKVGTETAAQIRARRMIKADGNVSKWWTELSPEAQEEYVAEHPNSKYADMKKKADAESKSKSSNPDKKPITDDTDYTKPEVENKPKIAPDDGGMGSHRSHEGEERAPSNEQKKPAAEHPLNEDFPLPKPGDPVLKMGSPFRAQAAGFLRKKTANIVSHLKGEVKEWKHAGHALAKLTTGKGLDHTDKHAIASVAADIALITTSILVTGGAAHGIAAFFKHFGTHMAQEALMKAAVKGVITHASFIVTSAAVEDLIVENAIKMMMDEFENGDLNALMAKYGPASKAEPGQTEVHPDPEAEAKPAPQKTEAATKLGASSLNMGPDGAGAGRCPERDCGKPMQIALVSNGDKPVPSYICTSCRVSLPIPNDHAFYANQQVEASAEPVLNVVDKIRGRA